MKKNVKKIVLLFLLSLPLYSFATAAGKIIYATDYGLKANSYLNGSSAITAAIKACKESSADVLKLPSGRIDIWPEQAPKRELYISNSSENDSLSKVRSIALLLENMRDLTIEGENTLIILHGKMISFALIHCENITLKGISFDYERPSMSEIKLLTVSDSLIHTQIHRDSRYTIDSAGVINLIGEGWRSNSFHTIRVSPTTEQMTYSSFSPFLKSQATDLGCNEVLFKGSFDCSRYKAGDILTVRDHYRDNVGTFINRSKNIRLINITMRYMHGLGIVSQFSENLHFKKIEVAPSPTSGRIIAAFADCFHFSGCKGEITIEECRTSGAHDDGINVHGTHLQISAMDKDKMTVRFMHHQTYGFEAFFPGDSVAVINPQTLRSHAYAKIKSARLVNQREMEIQLYPSPNQSLIKQGDCLENITYTPNVTIRNCFFEHTNTRGILMTTRGKVLIENNTFHKTGMHAILIADDARSWYESGAVRDVTIRNNTFIRCGYNQGPTSYVIAVLPETTTIDPRYPVHHNIRIENNAFELDGSGLIIAKSTNNLLFKDNRVQYNPTKTGSKSPQITTSGCTNVQIIGNSETIKTE